jgi:hypothetical protein
MDSNQRMTGSKPVALPLGYTPTMSQKHSINIPLMVRKERLELSRREALEPKSSVSTNSTTPAYFYSKQNKSGGYSGTRTCDPIIMSDVL